MSTLLVVNSSPKSNSVSRRLTREFVANWQVANPQGTVLERDLSVSGIPLLNEEWIAASYTPEAQRTARQKEVLALSDLLVGELQAADTIVLGVPMHNFSVPAALKTWIDQVARVGKTFSYSAQGPKGLIAAGKKVVVIITRGAMVANGQDGSDPLASYLRKILGLLGLEDVSVVHADRQGLGEQEASQSVNLAIGEIKSLAQPQSDWPAA